MSSNSVNNFNMQPRAYVNNDNHHGNINMGALPNGVNPTYGAVPGASEIYGTTQNVIDSNPIIGKVKNRGMSDHAITALLIAPVYTGLWWFMEAVNTFAKGPDYAKTWMGKLGGAGDAVAGNGFYKNTIGRVFQGLGVAGEWVNNNIIEKFQPLNVLKKGATPAWDMAKMQKHGVAGFAFTQANELIEQLVTNEAEKSLANVAAKRGLKVAELVERKPNALANLKHLMLKKHFGINEQALADIKSRHDIPAIIKVMEKSKEKSVVIDKLFNMIPIPKWLGFLKRNVPMTEIINKLAAVAGKSVVGKTAVGEHIAKTGLGRFLPKASFYGIEGVTFAGFQGKLVLLMSSFFVAGALNHARKAEKGEKVKTFMEELASSMGFLIGIPLAAICTYAMAGWRYTGMKPEQIDAFEKSVAEIVKNNNKHVYSEAGFKQAIAGAKQLLKDPTTGPMKWVHAPFRWVGTLLSSGLSYMPQWNDPALKNSGRMAKFFSNIKTNAKCGLGIVGRAALVMAVIAPLFSNKIVQASHLIFGKPKHSILDGEPPAETTPETQQPALVPPHMQPMPAPITPTPVLYNNPASPFQPGNILQDSMNKAQSGQYSNTAAAPLSTSGADAGVVRKYVPAATAAPLPQEPPRDPSQDARIARAMRIAAIHQKEAEGMNKSKAIKV